MQGDRELLLLLRVPPTSVPQKMPAGLLKCMFWCRRNSGPQYLHFWWAPGQHQTQHHASTKRVGSLTRFSVQLLTPASKNSPQSVLDVQVLSYVWLFLTTWTAAHQASPSFTISRSLLKLMSVESVMSFHYLILCLPPLLLPSIFPRIGVFFNELALCIRWPKYWSFSSSISPSSEYSRFMSSRIDRFAVPGC